jgi:hypothetical protein
MTLHYFQQLRGYWHALEHADVGSTRIATGHRANGGAESPKDDAYCLAQRCSWLTPPECHSEHVPVRQDMPAHVLLPEHMCPFQVNDCFVVSSFSNKRPGQSHLVPNGLLVTWVHARFSMGRQSRMAGADYAPLQRIARPMPGRRIASPRGRPRRDTDIRTASPRNAWVPLLEKIQAWSFSRQRLPPWAAGFRAVTRRGRAPRAGP